MTHESGIIHTWTFDQETAWIDIHGREHNINLIGSSYVANIVTFLLRGARHYRRAWIIQHDGLPTSADANSPMSDVEWIESRPLFKALMRRLAHGPQTVFTVKGA